MKFLTVLAVTASFFSTNADAGVVESHLSNIRDRIRACAVLPYTLKYDNKVFHALRSHCPEVRVKTNSSGKAQASIKIGGHVFQAILVETTHSDGDFFDVVIREPISNDMLRLHNVLAFDDVLLGILNGRIEGLRQAFVVDKNLIQGL